MTWGNRIKLAVGLVVVLVIVSAATIVFHQRQNSAQSTSATIVADHYPVGTDYGGIIARQYVQDGDEVAAGDPLFQVRSLQLQRDIAAGSVVDPESVNATDDGTATITASVAGIVSGITVPQGGFAQAGAVLASIDEDDSLSVSAEFVLSARDYARIAEGAIAEIELPNDTELTGSVTGIDVATVDGQAASTVTITSDALEQATATGLFRPGTPVVVTLRLRDDGPLAGVNDAVRDLLQKMGL